ncbi:MAG: hypothetical protein KAH22_02885 [Thiotrichaceae bacterium]|nr:hypothetical protein [Thiotrichaceae bacterium]
MEISFKSKSALDGSKVDLLKALKICTLAILVINDKAFYQFNHLIELEDWC